MLKTVGSSGQISLGKKFAGHNFRMEVAADGAVTLTPVNIVAARSAPARRKPRFHVVKVEQVLKLSRDELHERGTVS